jgi:glycosyltransferase involved in cell wall biosynthesis
MESNNDRMSILGIISNPAGWTGGVVGGGEIRAVEIFKKWHLLGVHVQTLETSPSPSNIMKSRYRVHIASSLLRTVGLNVSIINTALIFLNYLFMLKRFKDDFDFVVASTSNFTDVFPAWVFSKFFRTRFAVVFQISSYTSSFSRNYRIRREEGSGIGSSLVETTLSFIVIRLAKEASAIFCLSKPIVKMLRKLDFPREYLHLTSMGLNHKDIESAVAKDQKYDGIFLGRVEWAKGIFDLLKAWKIIIEKRPNASLVIIGAGDFLEKAKQYAENAKMDRNVKFTGFVVDKEKYAYLKSGRVFIYPSKIKEGWGLAIAEAMACGLPVVCTDNPVFSSIFGDCKSVVFVSMGNVQELASAILHLLNSEGSLRSYGVESKIYVQKFCWEAVAERELATVKSLCRNPSF